MAQPTIPDHGIIPLDTFNDLIKDKDVDPAAARALYMHYIGTTPEYQATKPGSPQRASLLEGALGSSFHDTEAPWGRGAGNAMLAGYMNNPFTNAQLAAQGVHPAPFHPQGAGEQVADLTGSALSNTPGMVGSGMVGGLPGLATYAGLGKAAEEQNYEGHINPLHVGTAAVTTAIAGKAGEAVGGLASGLASKVAGPVGGFLARGAAEAVPWTAQGAVQQSVEAGHPVMPTATDYAANLVQGYGMGALHAVGRPTAATPAEATATGSRVNRMPGLMTGDEGAPGTTPDVTVSENAVNPKAAATTAKNLGDKITSLRLAKLHEDYINQLHGQYRMGAQASPDGIADEGPAVAPASGQPLGTPTSEAIADPMDAMRAGSGLQGGLGQMDALRLGAGPVPDPLVSKGDAGVYDGFVQSNPLHAPFGAEPIKPSGLRARLDAMKADALARQAQANLAEKMEAVQEAQPQGAPGDSTAPHAARAVADANHWQDIAAQVDGRPQPPDVEAAHAQAMRDWNTIKDLPPEHLHQLLKDGDLAPAQRAMVEQRLGQQVAEAAHGLQASMRGEVGGIRPKAGAAEAGGRQTSTKKGLGAKLKDLTEDETTQPGTYTLNSGISPGQILKAVEAVHGGVTEGGRATWEALKGAASAARSTANHIGNFSTELGERAVRYAAAQSYAATRRSEWRNYINEHDDGRMATQQQKNDVADYLLDQQSRGLDARRGKAVAEAHQRLPEIKKELAQNQRDIDNAKQTLDKRGEKYLKDDRKQLLEEKARHEEALEDAAKPNRIPKLSDAERSRIEADHDVMGMLDRWKQMQAEAERMKVATGLKGLSHTDSGLYAKLRSYKPDEVSEAPRARTVEGDTFTGKPSKLGGLAGKKAIAYRTDQGYASNAKRTGRGHAYNADFDTMLNDTYSAKDVKNYRQKQFLDQAIREGAAIPTDKNYKSKGPSAPNPKWQDLPERGVKLNRAEPKDDAKGELEEDDEEQGHPDDQPNKGRLVQNYAMKEPVADFYEHVTNYHDLMGAEKGLVKGIGWLARKATGLSLSLNPLEVSGHGLTNLNHLANQGALLPDWAKTIPLVGDFIAKTPGISHAHAMSEVWHAFDRPDFDTRWKEFGEDGGIPSKALKEIMGSGLLDHVPFAHWLPDQMFGTPKGFGNGLNAMDIRCRFVLYNLMRDRLPEAGRQKAVEYANTLGQYVAELQAPIVRRLKPIMPFLPRESQTIIANVRNALGFNDVSDAMSKTDPDRMKYMALTSYATTLGYLVSWAGINYAVSAAQGDAKFPWEKRGLKLGDVDTGMHDKDGAPIVVPFTSYAPGLSRALRWTMLAPAAYEAFRKWDSEGHTGGIMGMVGDAANNAGVEAANNIGDILGQVFKVSANLTGHELQWHRTPEGEAQQMRATPIGTNFGGNLAHTAATAFTPIGMAAKFAPASALGAIGLPAVPGMRGTAQDEDLNAEIQANNLVDPLKLRRGEDDALATQRDIRSAQAYQRAVRRAQVR